MFKNVVKAEGTSTVLSKANNRSHCGSVTVVMGAINIISAMDPTRPYQASIYFDPNYKPL